MATNYDVRAIRETIESALQDEVGWLASDVLISFDGDKLFIRVEADEDDE